ncbi:hypothetical protein ACHQM5_019225 [Ranunculus cassubicifolius]
MAFLKSPNSVKRTFLRSSNSVKNFIDLCIDEINMEGYHGSSLTKISWVRIIARFHEKYDMDLSIKLCRNKWDFLRKRYIAWKFLEQTVGNTYNEVTGMFVMSDEQWDNVIQARISLFPFAM